MEGRADEREEKCVQQRGVCSLFVSFPLFLCCSSRGFGESKPCFGVLGHKELLGRCCLPLLCRGCRRAVLLGGTTWAETLCHVLAGVNCLPLSSPWASPALGALVLIFPQNRGCSGGQRHKTAAQKVDFSAQNHSVSSLAGLRVTAGSSLASRCCSH